MVDTGKWVYLACALTHVPRAIFMQYAEAIHLAAKTICDSTPVHVKYALMDSDPQLELHPEIERPRLCYDWDRQMVQGSNLVVADLSYPSVGVGIELQLAESAGIPVVLMYGDHGDNVAAEVEYANPDKTRHQLQIGKGTVSFMALGMPNVVSVHYYRGFDMPTADVVKSIQTLITKDGKQVDPADDLSTATDPQL